MSTEKKQPLIDFKDLLLLKKGEIENYQIPYEIFGYRNGILIVINVDLRWGYPDTDMSGRSVAGYTTPKVYIDITVDGKRYLTFLYGRSIYEDSSNLYKVLEKIGDPIYFKYIVPYISKAIDEIAVKTGFIPEEEMEDYKEKQKEEEQKDEEQKEIVSTKGYDIALVKWEALKIANLLKGLGKEAEKIFLEELNKNLEGDE